MQNTQAYCTVIAGVSPGGLRLMLPKMASSATSLAYLRLRHFHSNLLTFATASQNPSAPGKQSPRASQPYCYVFAGPNGLSKWLVGTASGSIFEHGNDVRCQPKSSSESTVNISEDRFLKTICQQKGRSQSTVNAPEEASESYPS